MKHPITSWTYKQVETWRKKSACIGKGISYVFTDIEKKDAIAKLQELYPKSKVYSAFAERILYLSELY